MDAAINAGVPETEDLDWKSELPPIKGLPQSDVPKDIAAMANADGGMIVYGVEESQKAATGRKDTGEFTEGHERTYRNAAVSAISPPAFGLDIYRLGTDPLAVAVVIPASVDGPHLIYKNDYFGAPIRNDADTVRMRERQIEAMYRARFDERRHSSEAIDALYDEAATGRNTNQDSSATYVSKALSYDEETRVSGNQDHCALLEAVREGDLDKALRVEKRHLEATLKSLISTTAVISV